MLMRTFSPVLTANPHRFGPHGSTRTLPLPSSVAQMPSGVVGAAVGAAATAAGCGAAGAATAGFDGVSNPTAGVAAVEATAVVAGAGVDATGAAGWDAAAGAAGA